MNPWLVAGAVVGIGAVWFFAWCLCRAAANGDRKAAEATRNVVNEIRRNNR